MIAHSAARKLYAFSPASTWPALAPFIAGKPDDKLIAAQWDEVLRMAASVRTGTVSASLLRKRLGAFPRQNGLALALREIGRIERTLQALDWLERPGLRRQATAEPNKGESRNALAGPYASTASGGCTTARPRPSSTGPAASPWSRPPSRCGTPSISAAPWTPRGAAPT